MMKNVLKVLGILTLVIVFVLIVANGMFRALVVGVLVCILALLVIYGKKSGQKLNAGGYIVMIFVVTVLIMLTMYPLLLDLARAGADWIKSK